MTEVTVHQVETENPDNYRWIVVTEAGVIEKRYNKLEDAVTYCNECDYTYEISKAKVPGVTEKDFDGMMDNRRES